MIKPWVPDPNNQRIAQNACRMIYKGARREDGTPVRPFQNGGVELNDEDVVRVMYRRTAAEQEEVR